MEERLVKLQAKIAADGNLAEKLFTLETPDAVQSFLKELELEFSLEEIGELKTAIVAVMEQGQKGELSDEALENIAGGIQINLGPINVGPIMAGPINGPGSISQEMLRSRW